MAVLITVLFTILIQAIGLGIICGLTFLVCMGFGINFTIWTGLAIWAILILIKVVSND